MSFYDDGRWVNGYTNEEIDLIFSKLSDPVFKKDLWFVEPDTDKVIEVYVNFDSGLPGIEWNYYQSDFVLEAYKLANGDAQKFFEILTEDYYQEYRYIADDEDVEFVKGEMSCHADAEGFTKETMEAIVAKIKKERNAE